MTKVGVWQNTRRRLGRKMERITSLNDTKVIKISAYRRRKLIERNKFKFITVMMIVALTISVIYLRKDMNTPVGNQISVPNPTMIPYETLKQ
jgi:hypothetical protein